RPALDEAPLVLSVTNLSKRYQISRGIFGKPSYVDAVNNVGFALHRGETVGIVGESGYGKSTIACMLMGSRGATSGPAVFHGRCNFTMRGSELAALRRKIQMVCQDPYSSLNPSMRIEEIIAEPWRIHTDIVPSGSIRDRACELLEQVGMGAEH